MKKKLYIVTISLISLLLVCGCSVKLKNGEEAAVSFSNGGISANDFYEILKEKYGEDEIVDAIDTYLLNKEYATEDDGDKNAKNDNNSESAYVTESIEQIKSTAKSNDVDYETYIKQYYNVDDELALKEYLKLNYKRNKWIEEYTQDNISDTDIQKYYDEKIVGDMKLSHILISPDVSSEATDEEKEAAEAKAKEEAEKVIVELNNGAKFTDMVKKYSDDDATKNNAGSLGYINRDGYDEAFIEGAIPLKVGKYTTTPVKSSYGYHIILKSKQKKKDSLDDVKDDIKETIATEKLEADQTLGYKALEALREKYKMNIKDSTLNKAYKRAIDELYGTNEDEE